MVGDAKNELEEALERRRAYQREWARKRRAEIRAKETPEERERRRQQKRASDALYYERHREEMKARTKKYVQENKEKAREYQRKYRKKHQAKRKAYLLKYREEHREEMAETGREYRRKNHRRLEAYKRSAEQKVKVDARRLLRGVVAAGLIEKPTDCEGCGQPTPKRKLHGHHHRGYDHPLDVQWLCAICHGKTRRS